MKNAQDAEKKMFLMPFLAVLSDAEQPAPQFSGQFFFLKNISCRSLSFTPFLFLRFHPQFFTSFLCGLTLERSQKVPYYSLKRKSNCDFDPAAYGGRAEGAWSSARLAGLRTLPFPLSSSSLLLSPLRLSTQHKGAQNKWLFALDKARGK